MASLDELLAPITPERFFADYHGRKPLHIPVGGGAPKAAVLDWPGLNVLLSQTSNWTPQNLKLVHDGEPVPPSRYCVETHVPGGVVARPSPARIDVLLSTGASLIANEIQGLTPALQATADMLSRTFAAQVGANAYCSFGGVQAFGTHFDLHDVFAVHTQGEKTWRLYQNRADDPVAFPVAADDEVRRWFQQTRGPLMQEVRMRPGDVLYLPRGWYHDALTDSEASLHVTFSVTPLHGRAIFALLEQAAMQDPAFRAYLPPAHTDDGKPLQDHLAGLGRKLAALAALPAFRDELAMAQQRLSPRPTDYDLPVRKALTLYRPTGLMPPAARGPAGVAMQWALSQRQFTLEDMVARFDFVDADTLRGAVVRAEHSGVFQRL